jgi:hypothetical protein
MKMMIESIIRMMVDPEITTIGIRNDDVDLARKVESCEHARNLQSNGRERLKNSAK